MRASKHIHDATEFNGMSLFIQSIRLVDKSRLE